MEQSNAVIEGAASRYWRPRRIGHANIFIDNYERAADYYCDVVGFREVYRQPNNMATFVSNGNTYHDLGLTDIHSRYCKPGQTPGLWHIAFEVETEVDLVYGYDRAIADGVRFESVADHDVAHSLYFLDPDGLLVEVYADVMDDWRAHRSGIINKEKPSYVPGVTSEPVAERLYPKDPEFDVITHAVFHPKKVSNTALVTAHFEDLFAFYTGVIGLSPLVGGSESAFAILCGTLGAGDLTLYRSRPGLENGFHHIGFEVWNEGDLDNSIEAMATQGIAAERVIDHAARRAVTMIDPDGIRLQFFVNRDWRPEALRAVDEETAHYLL